MSNLKYVVFGAGGTGGVLSAHLADAGLDATLIARNAHLKAIRENGLRFQQMWDGKETVSHVKACSAEEYSESPDVIFVCVKGYSIGDAVKFVREHAAANTVVIPILNIYGTGAKMQEQLPDILCTDGCMYVSANIKEPGVIVRHGSILRVVFGVRKPEEYRDVLKTVEEDLNSAGVLGILTDEIQKEALIKFSYVSAVGAASLYWDATAGNFFHEGPERDMLKAMIGEITSIGNAMGIRFEEDLVERNIKILEDFPPESTTSMQRDVLAGRPSEMDGQIFEVVRLGRKLNVPVPEYEKAAAKYGFVL